MPSAKQSRLQAQSLARLEKVKLRPRRKAITERQILNLQKVEGILQGQIKTLEEAGKDTSRPKTLLADIQAKLLRFSTAAG